MTGIFDRLADDQIVMVIDGQWRRYSLSLALAPGGDVLRLICTFEMDPPEAAMPALYETLSRANDIGVVRVVQLLGRAAPDGLALWFADVG